MPSAEHGLQRGFGMIVGAIVVAVLIGEVVPSLVETGLLPSGLFWWVIPASIVTAVMTVDASRFWSFGYLGGVVVGIFIALPALNQTEFIGPLDWLVYGGIATGAVTLRIKIHSSSF